MNLTLVPPANVEGVWGGVSGLLERVLSMGGAHTLDTLKVELEAGRSQLWIVHDDGVRAAVVTTINVHPVSRVCLIWLCAGDGLREWVHLIADIEAWAAGLGCSRVSLQGRPGWGRVLPDYDKTKIILEKRL